MLWIIIGILTSYLIGSIPTAYIFGRALKGIDIRSFGSRNVGATNALRVLGKGAGITVLVLDTLKGLIVVVFLSNELLSIVFGIACIIGHIWTIFLKFKGGKGMATALGVLLGLAFKIAGLKIVLGLAILTWLIIFILTRIVSLASILSAAVLPLLMVIFKQSPVLIFVSFLLSALVIYRHKHNLQRIIQGKEPRLY